MKTHQSKKVFAANINQHGFAVVYGLVILLVASLTGVALITMSGKDRIMTIDYGMMRTAVVASQAAITAVDQQCKSNPNDIVNILNAYKTNTSSKWLLGKVTDAMSEKKISLDPVTTSSSAYSAQILSFNPANMVLEIEGRGYGINGGTKKSIGVFQLAGLAVATAPKKYALYIGGEARNFDAVADITGDVFFGGDVHFNGGANGSIFKGTFKTADCSNLSSFDAYVTFNQNTFFQTPVKIQTNGSSVKFKQAVGFTKNVQFEGVNPDASSNVYFNSTTSGNSKINMLTSQALHSGSASPQNVNGTLVSNNGTIDIASKLSMSADDDFTPYTVDVSAIPSGYKLNSSFVLPAQFNVDNVQALYDQKLANGQLWNGFLVIRVTMSHQMTPDASVFNGKVIWIVENTLNCLGNWYFCGPNSMSLVYVTNGGKIQEMGSSGLFRGYINVDGNGQVIYKWSAGGIIDGAIHHVSTNAGWQVNSGTPLKITYNEQILDNLASTGVVKKTSGSGLAAGTIYLQDVKIRSRLVGVYF